MRMLVTSLGAVFALAIAATAEAADCCAAPEACMPVAVEACDPGCADPGCADPGCCGPCARKVCRVVTETKKVKKHVWVVECEEHCPSLPGSGLFNRCKNCCGVGCGACGPVCQQPAACGTACGSCDPCASVRAKTHCPPICGKVRCRKVLKKKEIECEVPSYKCVVTCTAPCVTRAASSACTSSAPASEPAPTSEDSMENAPLPPVVGTAYLK